jgi:hypothetical protein
MKFSKSEGIFKFFWRRKGNGGYAPGQMNLLRLILSKIKKNRYVFLCRHSYN